MVASMPVDYTWVMVVDKAFPLQTAPGMEYIDTHEKLQMDHASELFKVLVIKTEETIPYSSVFLQLYCKY